MTKDYSNFAKNLDTKIYPQAEPGQITMEDIVKCRGSSQSMVATWINQLITFCKTGKFVTDERIKNILINCGVEKAGTISDLFMNVASIGYIPESDKHAAKLIKRDQKMAADLAEIFDKAADGLGKDWDRFQTEAKKAHFMIHARHQLDKYDPILLLRAAAFDKTNHLRMGEATKLFIEYLKRCPTPPKTEKQLKDTYDSFVREITAYLPQGISRENDIETYIQLRNGFGTGVTSTVDNMSVSDLLKFLAPTELENHLKEITDINTEQPRKEELLKLMFEDPNSVAILDDIAKKMVVQESHDFILAFLDLRSAPLNKKKGKENRIRENFIGENAPQQVNIPGNITNDLKAVYKHVVDLYLKNVFRIDRLDEINEAIDQFRKGASEKEVSTVDLGDSKALEELKKIL